MDLSKYVELFLSESREHLSAMNEGLLVLERIAGSNTGSGMEGESVEVVARMFRAVHTIKGMGGAMQYAEVTERSHLLETTLDNIRQGITVLSESVVAHLYEETDALARAVEASVQPPQENAAGKTGVVPTRARKQEFLSRHVRVDASRLDALMDLAGELEIARLRLERVARDNDPNTLESAVTHLSRLVADMREQVATVRMVPVGHVFERFPSLVRDTARSLGKELDFVVNGKEIEIDRSTLDALGDPVMHLLRNAIDHGIEPTGDRVAAGKPSRARLTLSAQRETNFVVIRVADDGRGVDRDAVMARARERELIPAESAQLDDRELLEVLTHAGFSTAKQVTEVSGRGVGLDVVDETVRSLGGTLELRSIPGRGTVITLRLPFTVSVVRALLARLAGETYAIPITNVIETIEIDPVSVESRDGRLVTTVRDTEMPMVSLRSVLGLPALSSLFPKAVTVDVRGRRAALVVDDFVGHQDIVVKQYDPVHGAPDFFGGATILSDGAPALILDVNSLV